MRLGEGDDIEEIFSGRNLHFIRVNAADRYFAKLVGVTDPEEKRKIIGAEFIYVFEEEARKLGAIPFLAQGTIYPDIVESGSEQFVKSHHNVGGLPKDMGFEKVVEPLAGLYKNEVREVGLMLGLPTELVNRQPFPGPGLGVRVMGEVTPAKVAVLQQADAVVRAELDALAPRPSQYFAVMTDTYTVGVKNGQRTDDPVIAIRAVVTEDFMTAKCARLTFDVLERMAGRIAEIDGVSRVVYDLSGKPPGTVEWQ